MPNPLDPTVLHEAECERCGTVYADGDVLEDGICPVCLAEMEEEEPDDED